MRFEFFYKKGEQIKGLDITKSSLDLNGVSSSEMEICFILTRDWSSITSDCDMQSYLKTSSWYFLDFKNKTKCIIHTEVSINCQNDTMIQKLHFK